MTQSSPTRLHARPSTSVPDLVKVHAASNCGLRDNDCILTLFYFPHPSHRQPHSHTPTHQTLHPYLHTHTQPHTYTPTHNPTVTRHTPNSTPHPHTYTPTHQTLHTPTHPHTKPYTHTYTHPAPHLHTTHNPTVTHHTPNSTPTHQPNSTPTHPHPNLYHHTNTPSRIPLLTHTHQYPLIASRPPLTLTNTPSQPNTHTPRGDGI